LAHALNEFAKWNRRNRYGGVSIPSRLESMPSSSAPGVTIIRPLCGLDNNLYHTLEAAMKLSYPKYEVIFALQDERDEAIPVVKMIMERYPEVSARIIIGASLFSKFRQ
jgi:ceramide glucosyltransferase